MAIITEITKRNGNIVPFRSYKITRAIQKAFQAAGISKNVSDCNKLSEQVEFLLIKNGVLHPTVEEVQDAVEKILIQQNYAATAKAYILYRAEKSKRRELNADLMKKYQDIVFNEESEIKKENANIDGNTPMGTMLKFGSEGSKAFALKYLVEREFAEAHENGDIHIHDLDFMATGTTTCTQINIIDLFRNGFCTGHGFLREPQSILSYAALAAIVIQANQNDQHGGQSIPNFDFSMAEGVKKTYQKFFIDTLEEVLEDICCYKLDKEILETIDIRYKFHEDEINKKLTLLFSEITDLEYETIQKCMNITRSRADKKTEKATHQAMESFIHNLNTMHSRAGAQVPFSSINYGTDISEEGRLVTKELLNATQEGLGNGETPIFPIQIFKMKKGINYNLDDPNYDLFQLAIKTSAKRLFPNFSNLDAPFNAQYYKPNHPETEVAYMGCVDGNEKLLVVFNNNDVLFEFKKAWPFFSSVFPVKKAGITEYIDLKNTKIYDSNAKSFVLCKKIIRNPDLENWYKVTFKIPAQTSSKKYIYEIFATADHPFPVTDKGRTIVKNIKIGNFVPTCSDQLAEIIDIEFVGYRGEFSYDVETETDCFDCGFIQSHNCRTRVIGNTYDPQNEISFGRGNLSFTSINLPRIALNNPGDWNGFYTELNHKLELVAEQLQARLKFQGNKRVKDFPFLMGQKVWLNSGYLSPNDTLEEVLKQGTLSIGFIGLAETMVAMTDTHHGENQKTYDLAYKVIKHMRNFVDEKSVSTGLNFSLIATPAEGLSGRFIAIDKKKFGVIQGVTEREYYTNSFHIPVYYPITAHKKIELEAPFHQLTNGGHISYVEIDGNPSMNLQAFEKIIRCMHDNNIGYGSVNHPVDRDCVCGYNGIIGDICPKCDRREGDFPFERIRRITGYLVGTIDRWNTAKKAEEKDRIKHNF